MEKALAGFHASFESIASLRAIPALSPDIADAVKVVINVGKMVDLGFKPLKQAYYELALASGSEGAPPLDLSAMMSADRTRSADLVLPLIILNQKVSDLGAMLDLGMESIAAQNALIDVGIKAIEARAPLLALLAAGVIILGAPTLALVVSTGISRTIEGLDRSIGGLTTGDLSVRLASSPDFSHPQSRAMKCPHKPPKAGLWGFPLSMAARAIAAPLAR